MSDKFKPIKEITESELQELWPLIGGSPHLFEYGKEELRKGLSEGHFEDLQMDYYTMAAIVDYLRSKGYQAGAIDQSVSNIDELWDEYSELIDDDIDSLTRWAGSVVIDKENFKKLMQKLAADAGSGKEEWDSQKMVGSVKERFKELEAKGWDWCSFYNGWLEGRADMFAQVKGIGKYKESGKEEAVTMNQRIAQQILKVRDAIVARDMDLAYHELYKIASPDFDKMSDEVWADIEKAASKNTNNQNK